MHKILIAEDEIGSRRMLVSLVESWGYTTIQAANGLSAWSILRDNPDISVVIADVMMPELNGRELITRIRGDAVLCQMPIIIVSGIVGLDEIDELLSSGVSRFLPKPVNALFLRDYLTALVSHSNSSPDKTPIRSATL